MPGLCDENGINTVVRQRYFFGGAQQRGRVRQRFAQHVEHLGDRVDGHNVEPAFDEPGRQLAGAGTQVEHIVSPGRQ